ncbi:MULTISPECIES: WXG100 family type VII secretion target [Mycobacteriaceae]|jgi:uncharacterized protein YukE|uniref:WXG100 family type VII secretion target n=1 Tax=Mycobacteriaceae TaxID=1762 RepID=UPI00058FDB8A|nr:MULTISPECIES: WXG100 family type VII secretion target [Mycobacteriaceae]MCV7063590.1 WXG100 family type VII secretion target [Mycolicibacterium vaccae]WNG87832.1 WXG100 family type VII secretion target [Mycobacterium sp. ITM-2016-00317]
MALEADVASLATEAGTFDRIAGELTAVRGQVESTAAALAVNMDTPDAGRAAQAALLRYQEASDQQIRLLTDISQNIQISGTKYEATDADNSSRVAASMSNVL